MLAKSLDTESFPKRPPPLRRSSSTRQLSSPFPLRDFGDCENEEATTTQPPSPLELSSSSSTTTTLVRCSSTHRQVFPNLDKFPLAASAAELSAADSEVSRKSPDRHPHHRHLKKDGMQPSRRNFSPSPLPSNRRNMSAPKHRNGTTEDVPLYPAKKRRGTPKKKAPAFVGVGQENPNSLGFPGPSRNSQQQEVERIQLNSSPAATSLFVTRTTTHNEGMEMTPRRPFPTVDSKFTDPWELVSQLSPEEQCDHYWTLCYGIETEKMKRSLHESSSARQSLPIKSCFSKSRNATSAHFFGGLVSSPSATLPGASFATPKSSLPYQRIPGIDVGENPRVVKFGPTRAAEYESNDPSLTLTAMSPDEAASRYPIDIRELTEAETSLLQETKDNTALLEGWEDQDDNRGESPEFTLIEESDDSNEGFSLPSERFRENSKQRRSSSLFLPAVGSRKLLEEDSDGESNEGEVDVLHSSKDLMSPAGPTRSPGDCEIDHSIISGRGRQKSSHSNPLMGSNCLPVREISSADTEQVRNNKRSSMLFTSPEAGCPRSSDKNSDYDDDEQSYMNDSCSACTEETWTPEGTGKDRCALASMNLPGLSIGSPIAVTNHATVPEEMMMLFTASPIGSTDSRLSICPSSPIERKFSNDQHMTNSCSRVGLVNKITMSEVTSALSSRNVSRTSCCLEDVVPLDDVVKHLDTCDGLAVEMPLLEQIHEFIRNRAERADLERTKIKSLTQSLADLERKLGVGHQVKIRLENAILDLEQKVQTKRINLQLLRERRDLYMQIGKLECEEEMHNQFQELVPLETRFTSDDALEVTFATKAFCIAYYALGKTIRIVADSATGIVSDIRFVKALVRSGCEESKSMDAASAASSPSHHNHHDHLFSKSTEVEDEDEECHLILKQELERLQTAIVEGELMDVALVVQILLLFLTRLELHYQRLLGKRY